MAHDMTENVVKRWRGATEAGLNFWCPGCDEMHSIRTESPHSNWSWNGDEVKPIIKPSILVTRPANPTAEETFAEYRKAVVCHSFVTDGTIQFLGDCTHTLANQTVPIPPLSTWRYE